MKDLSFDHKSAVVWSLPITLVLLAAVLLPHAIFYRENAFAELFRDLGWWLAPLFIVSVVIHELLHAVTVIALGRLRWEDVSYGFNWQAMMPFAHPRRAVKAEVYRATVAAPGVVLGILPAASGLVSGSGSWSAYGAIMLAAAAGDAMILWSLRRTPRSALVQDHPSRVGCEVVSA